MKSTKKCIKFGEILIDENRKFLLICVLCYMHFEDLQKFYQHSKCCKNAQHIQGPQSTKLNCEKGTVLKSTLKNDLTELLIYEIDKGKSDGKIIKNKKSNTNLREINEEVHDPRWYDDVPVKTGAESSAKNKATYTELIEEVTPFVQFRENDKTKRTATKPNSERQVTKSQKINTVSTNPNTWSSTTTTTRLQSQIRSQVTETSKTLHKNELNTSRPPTTTRKTLLKRKSEPVPLVEAAAPTKPLLENDEHSLVKRRKIIAQPTKTNNHQAQVQYRQQQQQYRFQPTTSTSVNSIRRPGNANNIVELAKKPITRTTRSESLSNNELLQQQKMPNKDESCSSSKSTISTSAMNKKTANIAINQSSQQKSSPAKYQIITQIHKMPTVMPVLPSKPIAAVKLENKSPNCPSTDNQKTAELLNKLKTRGLKVERTNPLSPPAPKPTPLSNSSNEQALEIIKKLQSNGTNVKIVQKSNPMTTTTTPIKADRLISTPVMAQTSPSTSHNAGKIINGSVTYISPSAAKRSASVAKSVLHSNPNFCKNVFIKKV